MSAARILFALLGILVVPALGYAQRPPGRGTPAHSPPAPASHVFAVTDTAPEVFDLQRYSNHAELWYRLDRVAPKSEFETWAAYRTRVNGTRQEYFALPILCETDLSYDAETEEMSARLAPTLGDYTLSGLNLSCSRRDGGSFVGTTGLGVRRRVSIENVDEWAVRGSNLESLTYPAPKWHMSPGDAAAQKGGLMLFLVAHPAAGEGTPLTWSRDRTETATIDDPVETRYTTRGFSIDEAWIWVVHVPTRRVIYRVKVLQPRNSAG
jgi:hypothetical protein